MVLIGAISIVRGILLFIIQIVAGIVAAYIVQALFQGKLAVSTTLGGGTTIAQGVLIEMILTAQLVFTIFMLAAEKHQGNFIAPVGIGLSLFIAELVGESFHAPSNKPGQTQSFPPPPFSPLHASLPLTSPPRRLLDRRVPQPRPLLRTRRRHPHVPHDAVDLLGRSHLRLPLRGPALQADQVARIRECESGPGVGSRGWEVGEIGEWEWQWQGSVAGGVTDGFMGQGAWCIGCGIWGMGWVRVA